MRWFGFEHREGALKLYYECYNYESKYTFHIYDGNYANNMLAFELKRNYESEPIQQYVLALLFIGM